MSETSFQPPATVAVLGLGNMGIPMANALVAAGYRVKGWTRSGRKDEALSQEVVQAPTATMAVTDAQAVVLATLDDAAAEAALFGSGAADALTKNAIVIDTGTSGPSLARNHFGRLSKRGLFYLDAPVSGGVVGAQKSTLTIFCGGESSAFEMARPVLEALGTPHLLGPPGSGQAAKLSNQIMVAIKIAAVAEGLKFAEKQGLKAQAFLKSLEGGFADSAVLRLHGPRMVARDFSAGGALQLHLKDLRLAADSDTPAFTQLLHACRARDVFAELAEADEGGLDHSAYIKTYDHKTSAS